MSRIRHVSFANMVQNTRPLTEGGLSITALDGVLALLLESSNLFLGDSFHYGHFVGKRGGRAGPGDVLRRSVPLCVGLGREGGGWRVRG